MTIHQQNDHGEPQKDESKREPASEDTPFADGSLFSDGTGWASPKNKD
jgi:hypothetical protein